MRTIKVITGLLLAGAIATGCTRENEVIPPAPYPVGGKGGKATLRVTPRHHLQNMDNGKVYIKYNSKVQPAAYDDSADVEYSDGRPMAIFKNLKWGDYYLFARDTNFNLADTIQTVTGGAHFMVPDSFENKYDLYLDVFDHNGK